MLGLGILTESSYTSDDGFSTEYLSESGIEHLEEQMLIDECMRMSDEERRAFLESEECQYLVEAGKMRKNTIVYLSGKDDLSRRTKMVALQMAKEANDPSWQKLKKNRIIERNLLGKIMNKYGAKAEKIARKTQKEWIRKRMPKNFGKFGGDARLSKDAEPKIKHGDGLVWGSGLSKKK